MVVLTIFLKNTVLLNNPKFQKGISITSNGSPLIFLIYIRHQMKWALQVVTPFILSKIKLDSLTKKEFTGKTCYIQNNDITKFMYTLGCPKAPPPPSQDTTLLSTWLTGCSAIKSIAKFLFTCKKEGNFQTSSSLKQKAIAICCLLRQFHYSVLTSCCLGFLSTPPPTLRLCYKPDQWTIH